MDPFCIHRQVARVYITSLLSRTLVANKNLHYFSENSELKSALKVEHLTFLQDFHPNQDHKVFDGMLSILLKYFMISEKMAVMLVTWSWWQNFDVDDIFWLLVTIIDARNHYLKVVTNRFSHQHLGTLSMMVTNNQKMSSTSKFSHQLQVTNITAIFS